MFSAMVRCSIWGSWGTYEMWSRSDRCVTAAMSCPSIRIAPAVMSMNRSTSLVRVVLPDPDEPTSPTCSPGRMSSVEPSKRRASGSVARTRRGGTRGGRRSPTRSPASGDVADLRLGGRDAGELGAAPERPRADAHVLEGLLERVAHDRWRRRAPGRWRPPPTTWWRASTSPMTTATQLRTASDDSICRRVRREDPPGPQVGRDRRAHEHGHVRLLAAPRSTGCARWSGWRWCRRRRRSPACGCPRTPARRRRPCSCGARAPRRRRRRARPGPRRHRPGEDGQHARRAETPSPPTRRKPQVTMSMSSTKAHEKVSSVEMTSPDGRSVCQRWLSPIRWS